MNNRIFANAEYEFGINLYEIKGAFSPLEKIGGGFMISGENFVGVAFHPEEKDYLIGVSYQGKAVLMRVN
jgi:hypothetical protein